MDGDVLTLSEWNRRRNNAVMVVASTRDLSMRFPYGMERQSHLEMDDSGSHPGI